MTFKSTFWKFSSTENETLTSVLKENSRTKLVPTDVIVIMVNTEHMSHVGCFYWTHGFIMKWNKIWTVYMMSICWLCYLIGTFGTWRDVYLSHGEDNIILFDFMITTAIFWIKSTDRCSILTSAFNIWKYFFLWYRAYLSPVCFSFNKQLSIANHLDSIRISFAEAQLSWLY